MSQYRSEKYRSPYGEFASIVRDRRIELGFTTPHELNKALAYSDWETIWRIENGEKVSLTEIELRSLYKTLRLQDRYTYSEFKALFLKEHTLKEPGEITFEVTVVGLEHFPFQDNKDKEDEDEGQEEDEDQKDNSEDDASDFWGSYFGKKNR